jgi:protein-disulfide isomerase
MDVRSRAARIRGRFSSFRGAGLALILALGSSAGVAAALAESGSTAGTSVLATVGDHQFNREEVDEEVLKNVSPPQLYDLRKRALDRLIDEYVVGQAAKKAGLSPDQYLQRESGGSKVTEADARKFYDAHKAEIDAQVKGQSFDQIKGRIIAGLKPERSHVASAGHPWSGGKDAAVTVVEFSDFQCPYCRAAEGSVKQIKSRYGDKIKFVYMDFPLSFHEHAMDAARAASCAAGQDKFWQYHDALFADQSKLAAADLKATAAKLGLDAGKFNACFDKGSPDSTIKADLAQGQALGVTGTPTFFVNGREIVGAQPPEKFSEVIDDELAAGGKAAANRQARKAD